jgi:hypothetical protein
MPWIALAKYGDWLVDKRRVKKFGSKAISG